MTAMYWAMVELAIAIEMRFLTPKRLAETRVQVNESLKFKIGQSVRWTTNPIDSWLVIDFDGLRYRITNAHCHEVTVFEHELEALPNERGE